MTKPNKEIAAQLTDGLVHLLLTELVPGFEKRDKHFIADAEDFDGWEPLDAADQVTQESHCGGDIDCVTAVPSESGWVFVRIRKFSAKHWRGRINLFLPQTFDFMYRGTYDDGTAGAIRLPVVRTASHVRVHPEFRIKTHRAHILIEALDGVAESLLNPQVQLDQTFAAISTYRKRSYWNVYLGHPGMARSRLATDQRGVRAFFADRDVGDGRRRAALLHWVAGHWRRRRPPSDEDVSWVNEHMRGKRDFSWNGIRGEVVPPLAA